MTAPAEPRVLVVRGGWEGHFPVEGTELFIPFLRGQGYAVEVSDTLDAYADPERLRGLDLIVQCWSEGRLTGEQTDGLLAAVSGGVGFAGWHGGIISTFREASRYHFMVGGQFLCHPGDFVDYEVQITPDRSDHPVVAGIGDFAVHTEQYFCHVDPTLDVLATTTFTGAHGAAETSGAVMPVIWTKRYGSGRVFVSTLGHFPADLELAPTRALTEQGLLWAAGRL